MKRKIFIVQSKREQEGEEGYQVYHDSLSAPDADAASAWTMQHLVNHLEGGKNSPQIDHWDEAGRCLRFRDENDCVETHTILKVTEITKPEDVIKAMKED